jgi:hypothetical protein
VATLRERAAAALTRRKKQADGVSVSYARIGANTLTLTAVPGQTTATSAELPGRVEISARDYLVAVEDLVDASGTEVPPAVGDRITETINGAAKTFELQTPENGEPAFRWCNENRAMYRLHMKAV